MVKSRNPRLSSSRGKKYKSKCKQKRSKSTRKSRKIKKRQCGGVDRCFLDRLPHEGEFTLDTVKERLFLYYNSQKGYFQIKALFNYVFGDCPKIKLIESELQDMGSVMIIGQEGDTGLKLQFQSTPPIKATLKIKPVDPRFAPPQETSIIKNNFKITISSNDGFGCIPGSESQGPNCRRYTTTV